MPGYGGTGQATLLRENQQAFLFQQATGVTGHASIAVLLERISRSSYPWGFSVQVYFTDVNGHPADPGAFELDIQASDIDQDSQYGVIGSLTATSLNASFAAIFSTTTQYTKYVRVFLRTLSNAVYTSVLVTR